MSRGKRLTYYIEKQGYTKKDFCKKYSLPYNSFVQVLADTRPLGGIILDKIHYALPNLNVHWLLYGEGPVEVNKQDLSIVNDEKENYNTTDVFEKTLLKYLENEAIIDKINEIAKKTKH